MKRPVESIEWLDHCSLAGSRGWRHIQDLDDMQPLKVESVGHLIKEDKRSVTLTGSLGGDEIDGEICIIKSCIIRRRVLRKGSK